MTTTSSNPWRDSSRSRVLQAAFSVWVVATLVFMLIHLTGNPIWVLAPGDNERA